MENLIFIPVTEAEGDNRRGRAPSNNRRDQNQQPTDYTEDENAQTAPPEDPEEEDDGLEADPDDNTPTDYSAQASTLDAPAEDAETDPDADGSEATDYTADDDASAGGAGEGDPAPGSEGEEAQDYTGAGTGDPDDPAGGDPAADGGELEADPNANPEDKQKQDDLMEDFVELYYKVGQFIDQLSESRRSDLLSNEVLSQVKTNLAYLRNETSKYIRRSFSTGKYTRNLFVYNQLIESLKINVTIVQKLGDLMSTK